MLTLEVQNSNFNYLLHYIAQYFRRQMLLMISLFDIIEIKVYFIAFKNGL